MNTLILCCALMQQQPIIIQQPQPPVYGPSPTIVYPQPGGGETRVPGR